MPLQRSLLAVLALGGPLVVAETEPAWADETFLCRDGSSVTIDNDNRATMQDHPCVKAWFADDHARRKAQAEVGAAKPGVEPVLHRHTVHRAAALRDLRQRPAYLAWSRARAAQIRSTARPNASVVSADVRSPPSQPLGVTIRVPAGR